MFLGAVIAGRFVDVCFNYPRQAADVRACSHLVGPRNGKQAEIIHAETLK